MAKNSFILYGNYEEQVKRLSNAQAGELLKIILHYVNTGEKDCVGRWNGGSGIFHD